jgi:hypothetical protein
MGGISVGREGSKGYRVNMGVYISETPSYTEVCPTSTTQLPLVLANYPYLQEASTPPKYLNPEDASTSGTYVQTTTDNTTFTQTNTFTWTLDKKY